MPPAGAAPLVVVRKVPGGKLFRLRLWPEGRVGLEGDFFLHPEDGLYQLEAWLGECSGMEGEEVAVRYLEQKLEEGSMVIIGTGAEDLVSALWEAKG